MTDRTNVVPDSKRKTDWRVLGACQDHDNPDLWFASGGTTQVAEAVAICQGCPVLDACAQWALTNREAWGVWGGMTESRRRTILRIRIKNGDAEPRRGGRPRAECGTASAYDRHVKYGEPIDEACREAHRVATAERRARGPQSAKKREPAQCGTNAGYGKHIREKTEICASCRRAHADADARLRRTGTSQAAA